jgi:GH43 family beta-xylosidase
MSSNHIDNNTIGNPVIPIYAADPHAELLGNRYYVYATNAGMYTSSDAFHKKVEGEAHGFAAWSSTDLRHWKSEGPILHFRDIPWAKELGDAWAPCIAERNGRYYFYFCASSRMGVAVGDSPTGPFADAIGEPLVPFRDDMSAIDPMVFIDDDGKAYFYWGAVPGSWLEGRGFEIRMHLSVRQLNDDMVTFAGPEISTIETQKSPEGWHSLNHIEASHVFKRQGLYYLMWSPGDFASDDDSRAYRVHYATSTSPLGPWKLAENNPVLSTTREIGVVGPGHHSTIQIPGTDEWYCVYHCHKGDVDRRTFIDRMVFNAEGGIEKIIPTLEGPAPRPIRIALAIEAKGPYSSGAGIEMKALLLEGAESQLVEFFSRATKIGESKSGTDSFQWIDAPAGFHRLTAKATLATGEIVTSAPLNIDVN